jgi:hypothetical protein
MLLDLESPALLCKRRNFLVNSRAIQVAPLPHLPLVRGLTYALLDLLEHDSEMQRAMGAADSFDGGSTNQGSPRKSHTTRQ